MKKIRQGILLGTSLLMLVGCNNETIETKPSTKDTTESTIRDTTESTTENTESTETTEEKPVNDPLWNQEKALALETFMSQWGTVMNQQYKEYKQGENVTYYDMQLPQDIFEKKRFEFFEVDKEEVSLEWYETEKEVSNTYQLLTIYSDADTQPDMEKHIYFFTLYNGEPRVLNGTLAQGSYISQPVSFSDTKNEQLKNGFTDIITKGKAEEPAVDSSEPNSAINSFNDAYNHALNNKFHWLYGKVTADTVEFYSINENLKTPRTDNLGTFYDIVIETNDHQGTVMAGGKQFRVYVDGSITQRFFSASRDEWIKIL